jgi:hypothetical protein
MFMAREFWLIMAGQHVVVMWCLIATEVNGAGNLTNSGSTNGAPNQLEYPFNGAVRVPAARSQDVLGRPDTDKPCVGGHW